MYEADEFLFAPQFYIECLRDGPDNLRNSSKRKFPRTHFVLASRLPDHRSSLKKSPYRLCRAASRDISVLAASEFLRHQLLTLRVVDKSLPVLKIGPAL